VQRDAPLAVFVIDDPDRPPVALDRPLRIGRDAQCNVHIDDESVSRVHLLIEPGNPPIAVDCDSRNGTFVGQERLAPRARTPIAVGTVLRAGSALLLVDTLRARRTDGVPRSVAGGRDDALLSAVGPMRPVLEMADRLAQDDITVLLTGETGVGKEVLARYLHDRSPRRQKPFVPVHAAALTATLFESELFGHEKGAFTGATGDREGLFEQADGGTLFFDEIGELPLDMQPKLLRILEDRRVMRVGGRTARTVDVRIVAATNRDLAADAAKGTFRSDLYFRLSAFPLSIPSLRERAGEIPELARALLERASADRGRVVPVLSPEAMAVLEAHAWPGNVRELRSVMARVLLFAAPEATALGADEVERAIGGADASPERRAATKTSATDADPERERILAALDRNAGNQSAAAAELGISRRTLINRLDKLGIARPRKGRGA
jgi:transcriptional regulator with PAS, ATPase and Fis domain